MKKTVETDNLLRMRLENWLRAALIILGLLMVLGLIGWIIAGGTGVLWALVLACLMVAFSRRLPARTLLGMQGAGLLRRRQAPVLYAMLDVLYRRAGIRCPPALFYVPSVQLNAFAVGDTRDGGIAVTDGLLRRLDRRELTGVLAHEVSHLRHNDTWVMSMAAMVTELTVLAATAGQLMLLAMLPWIAAGELQVPVATIALLIFAPTFSTLLQLSLSRNREFAADMEAAALTGDPGGLASALATLERYQGSWLESLFGYRRPTRLRWLHTHPPTGERIARLAALQPTATAGHPGLWRTIPDERTIPVETPAPLGHRLLLRRRLRSMR